MTTKPDRQNPKRNDGPDPSIWPSVINILRALKGHHDANAAKYDEDEPKRMFYAERLAKWTRILGIFTIAVAVIGFLTLGVFLITLNETFETGEIERSDLQLSERATVTLNTVQIRSYGDRSEKKQLMWVITPIYGNTGNTETRNLVMSQSFILYGGTINSPWFNNASPEKEYPSFIGPHNTVVGPRIIMDAMDMNQFASGSAHLYTYGRIRYKDIFGTDRISQFCVQIIPAKTDYNVDTMRPLDVTLAQCQEHNCADDECKAD